MPLADRATVTVGLGPLSRNQALAQTGRQPLQRVAARVTIDIAIVCGAKGGPLARNGPGHTGSMNVPPRPGTFRIGRTASFTFPLNDARSYEAARETFTVKEFGLLQLIQPIEHFFNE
jgi:hypothetical protein